MNHKFKSGDKVFCEVGPFYTEEKYKLILTLDTKVVKLINRDIWTIYDNKTWTVRESKVYQLHESKLTYIPNKLKEEFLRVLYNIK